MCTWHREAPATIAVMQRFRVQISLAMRMWRLKIRIPQRYYPMKNCTSRRRVWLRSVAVAAASWRADMADTGCRSLRPAALSWTMHLARLAMSTSRVRRVTRTALSSVWEAATARCRRRAALWQTILESTTSEQITTKRTTGIAWASCRANMKSMALRFLFLAEAA